MNSSHQSVDVKIKNWKKYIRCEKNPCKMHWENVRCEGALERKDKNMRKYNQGILWMLGGRVGWSTDDFGVDK